MADKNKKSLKDIIKAALASRRTRHRLISVGFIAAALVIVVLVNVITGKLVQQFPEAKADFTSNQAFALSDDTAEYMGHLSKDVKLHINAEESVFRSGGQYFVQAQNLLDKMVSKSGGKFTYDFVDITENPGFTRDYPNIDWTTNENLGVIECGDQYKGINYLDCFTYDKDYYEYYQQYKWTGTTIEQAVLRAAVYVTDEEKIIVDLMTGEGESGYDGLTKLLGDNAYEVKEVSLTTGELDSDAKFVMMHSPAVDLSEASAEKLRKWLENDGKYGKNLIYIPPSPKLGEVKTPNLDSIIADWGMELNSGYVYETNSYYMVSARYPMEFIVDYTDYYFDRLQKSNVPVWVNYAQGVTINDSNMAHAILQTSEGAGLYPFDSDSSFDYASGAKGEPIPIAAEGQKAGVEDYSRVIVFSSSAMFDSDVLEYPSFNNGLFFMNVMNTIAQKDDSTVITSKSLEGSTLGKPPVSTQNTILIIFVFVLPAAILVTAVVLWIRRRNR